MVNENADLNEKLRQRLEQAETERTRAREQLRQHQAQSAQFHQVLASLRSSFDTKQEMLKELEVEMQEIGVKLILMLKSALVFDVMSCTSASWKIVAVLTS